MNAPITAVIITKNEQQMLENCLLSVKPWVEKLLVIDNNSTDKTVEIAESNGANVISLENFSFSKLRNEALKYVKNGWIFYIDADERVTPQLAKEICEHVSSDQNSPMGFKRRNICYGNELKYGGWGEDRVVRLFKIDDLQNWQGEIHESPVFSGKATTAQEPLIHLTHRNTALNLKKSSDWTIVEARLLAKAGTKVTFLTLLRKGIAEFIRRAILKKGYKDGMSGLIEALVQAMNRVFVYIQVWEEQSKPTLNDKYQAIEDQIKNSWQNFSE